jgi:hypothetical protein
MSPAMSSRFKYENPDDPHEIIRNTPWGDVPAWKASTLATTTMGAYDAFVREADKKLVQFRNDSVNLKDQLTSWAAELTAREEALDKRTLEVTDFAGRLAQFYEETEALRNKLKAEAEEEEELSEPNLPPVDVVASAPAPSGDLHTIPAKDPAERGDDQEPLEPLSELLAESTPKDQDPLPRSPEVKAEPEPALVSRQPEPPPLSELMVGE